MWAPFRSGVYCALQMLSIEALLYKPIGPIKGSRVVLKRSYDVCCYCCCLDRVTNSVLNFLANNSIL